jgi:hypothetical protein
MLMYTPSGATKQPRCTSPSSAFLSLQLWKNC